MIRRMQSFDVGSELDVRPLVGLGVVARLKRFTVKSALQNRLSKVWLYSNFVSKYAKLVNTWTLTGWFHHCPTFSDEPTSYIKIFCKEHPPFYKLEFLSLQPHTESTTATDSVYLFIFHPHCYPGSALLHMWYYYYYHIFSESETIDPSMRACQCCWTISVGMSSPSTLLGSCKLQVERQELEFSHNWIYLQGKVFCTQFYRWVLIGVLLLTGDMITSLISYLLFPTHIKKNKFV